MAVPKYNEMFNAVIQALHNLDGSASISELENEVANILGLSEDDLSELHRGNRTEFSYRLAWSRTYLKKYGVITNSSRGIWSLTPKGLQISEVDENDVVLHARGSDTRIVSLKDIDDVEEETEPSWQDELLDIVKQLKPDSFERLCKRLLRESGFVDVEITGKSGDGGIDGKGILKFGGLMSFNIVFQCKRYKESVGSNVIRDFRGAMIGRADKGLILTTGFFTRDARKEAQREGAPLIDLVDGQELMEKLKELSIGVSVQERIEEQIEIQRDYFDSI